MSPTQVTPKPFQIAAAVIGNALEWYDFIVFGFFTVIISRLFFPADSQYASLLLTTATFGVGFFMRPVGGVLLGIYADRRGRKAALLLVIALMTVAIAMIGFAPTYAAIGVAAPLLIVLARLLQGFSAGGEFASATSFLVESAPAHRRGFYGAWQMVGQGLAVLIFSAPYSRARSRRKHSTTGAGACPSCSASSLGRSGSTSVAISPKRKPSLNHAGRQPDKQRSAPCSHHTSGASWSAWVSAYRAPSRST
jgi:MFS family permease